MAAVTVEVRGLDKSPSRLARRTAPLEHSVAACDREIGLPTMAAASASEKAPAAAAASALDADDWRTAASAWADALDEELFEHVLPFWLVHSEDADHGGFFDCLTREGLVYDTTKHVWLQGRQVFLMARVAVEATDEQLARLAKACEAKLGVAKTGGVRGVTGVRVRPVDATREGLTAAASRGLRFLLDNAVDAETGTVWFALARDGRPAAAQRKPFSAAFLCMACSEVARATSDTDLEAQADAWMDTYRKWAADGSLLRGPAPPGAPPHSALAIPMIGERGDVGRRGGLARFGGGGWGEGASAAAGSGGRPPASTAVAARSVPASLAPVGRCA